MFYCNVGPWSCNFIAHDGTTDRGGLFVDGPLARLATNGLSRTLDREVKILLNGENAGNYRIKNGVKQGHAFSCILFILEFEPEARFHDRKRRRRCRRPRSYEREL